MPAADPESPPEPQAGRAAGWFFAAVAVFVLVAHGCHGPDEDHEPGVPPTSPADRADRSR